MPEDHPQAMGLDPGVHVLVSPDPVNDALRLARAARADLATTAIEAELAIDRRRRCLRARTLARTASEAGRLTDLIAAGDPQADDALLGCAEELRALAAEPDLRPRADALRAAAAEVQRAEAVVAAAAAARDRARAAHADATRRLEHHPARGAAADPDRARLLAARVHDAADTVRRLEQDQPAAPPRDPGASRELHRASVQLEAARDQAARLRRRIAIRLLQGAGAGLVLAGFALDNELSTTTVLAAMLLPVLVVALAMARARQRVRADLDAAGRAATAVAVRLFPDAVPPEAIGAAPGFVIDPLELHQMIEEANEEHRRRLNAATAALEEAMAAWIDLAGVHADVDTLDEVLGLAAEVATTAESLTAAEVALATGDREREAALDAWRRAVDAARGAPDSAPERLPVLLAGLRERQARQRVAAGRLDALRAAEARAEARARLAELLAGRSLGELDRAARHAAADADPEPEPRPLVVVDAGEGTSAVRRRALRRLLDDLDGALPVAVVTSDVTAPEWDRAKSAGQLKD